MLAGSFGPSYIKANKVTKMGPDKNPDFFFSLKLNILGTNGLPWTPAVKIWQFDLTLDHLDPEDPEGMRRSLCSFLFQTPTIWVSMDSPGPQQSRFGNLT